MRRPVKPQLPRTLTGSQAGVGGGGESHSAHSVNMHAEKTSGGAADRRERKEGQRDEH